MRLVSFASPASFTPTPENRLPLTLYWRADGKISQNYVIFIHLLDEKGQTVAQRDTAPRYGALNTTVWPPNELLDDDQSLPLPPNLPSGRYRLQMGIYNPVNNQRLHLLQGTTPTDQDSLILQEVLIK